MEYLETDATPDEIKRFLSLSGPSIESVTKVGDDYVYDVEVISNRIDYASVVGIAREAATILPMFHKRAELKMPHVVFPEPDNDDQRDVLEVIDPKNLCPNKYAVVMEITVGKSPSYVKNRLENCGVRSLNNLIDITNYVMIETGHPCHVFDYDRLKTGKILVRKAKDGESIITLDGKNHLLNSNDVVFDDGTGRIVDLPGIMGLQNSVVTDKTKKIIFWIETNDPKLIRKTSMRLGIRTLAASINEKNPDPEAAFSAFKKGIALFQKIAHGKIIGKILQIGPKTHKIKSIKISYENFDRLIGVKIERSTINNILTNLGFKILKKSDSEILVEVPSYRVADVSIGEDLVEEVARIYGYHNIPSVLQPPAYVEQPKDMEDLFVFQSKLKTFLKHLGLNEVINYSMISKQMIENSLLRTEDHLKLNNPISEEIEYLRLYLTPSLLKNVKDNEGKKDELRFFEIAKVYEPRPNDLPIEKYHLIITVNTSIEELKGMIAALFEEMNIANPVFENGNHEFFDKNIQGEIKISGERVGTFGKINPEIKRRFGITTDAFVGYFNFQKIISYYKPFKKCQPINPYSTIKLDKTFTINKDDTYQSIKEKAFNKSSLLRRVEFVSFFENKLTLRFYYSSTSRNITEEEAKAELV